MNVYTSVRIREDLHEWFHDTFPWKGSFTSFINDALEALKEEWGDHPGPREHLPEIVQRLKEKGF